MRLVDVWIAILRQELDPSAETWREIGPELVAMLLSLEWAKTDNDGNSCCPLCFGDESTGHEELCAWVELMTRIGALRVQPLLPKRLV